MTNPIPFSRRAQRPRFANNHDNTTLLGSPPANKGRRSAERRKFIGAAPHIQTSPLECAPQTSVRSLRHLSAYAAAAYRSPLAFRRSAAALVAATERFDSAQAVLHAMKCEGVTFAFGSRLSGAPRAPVIVPAGTMPGPPEGGVTSPARRNRTRPIQRLSPVDVPEVSEIRILW